MSYRKPEVRTLDEAKTIIEGTMQKGRIGVLETATGYRFIPAYDLDD